MPRSPRKPTTFFTTSSNRGTERSVCRAARSAGCSQVTGAIPVRTLRGRGAGIPVGSLMRCSYYACRLSTTRRVAPCFASELAARPRPVNWRPHAALADDAEPRLQPRYRAGLPSPDIAAEADRKSTRLNSSHITISYAVFCLKKKKKNKTEHTETRKQTGRLQRRCSQSKRNTSEPEERNGTLRESGRGTENIKPHRDDRVGVS